MLRIKCLTLLLVCSAAFPGIQAQQEPFSRAGKDHALLFAVKDYQEWGSLKNPIRDAEAIARVLEHKYGFTTTIIRNPSLDKIQQTIQQYLSRPFSADEQLFIYFSGHGEFVPYPNNPEEGKGYFIPADAKRHDPYRRSYLSWIDLLPDIDNIACKHIMLVVDACYSGSILKGKSGRPNELSHAEQFFLEVLPYPTRLGLTSGGKERTPDGHYHSPLTERLLSAFADNGGPNGVLSFYELYGYLQDIRPRPRNGYFGRHDVNSDFLFLYQPPSSARFVTDPDGNRYPIVRLAGKQWLGRNLNLEVPGSYCYDDGPANCEEYGRLYTWEAAKVACSRLGPGWRLPTDEDWRGLLEAHGGYYDFSKGEEIGDAKKSCSALIQGGSSSFAALLGGGRRSGGEYLLRDRNGFYWSATEHKVSKAWTYSFGGVTRWVYRGKDSQSHGLSCRCLKG
ncbi:MAG: caspase family protein [Lewinellaceae bacterium]|nr:caspase family protein [Lewinellaceae bacterium]